MLRVRVTLVVTTGAETDRACGRPCASAKPPSLSSPFALPRSGAAGVTAAAHAPGMQRLHEGGDATRGGRPTVSHCPAGAVPAAVPHGVRGHGADLGSIVWLDRLREWRVNPALMSVPQAAFGFPRCRSSDPPPCQPPSDGQARGGPLATDDLRIDFRA